MSEKKICIIGGGAAGASCAARARRLDEDAKIVIFERTEHVSFASCGLPYYVGNIITKRDKLFIMAPELFKSWLDIEVRVLCEIRSIDREKKELLVTDLASGKEYTEKYDILVLAQGAVPILPRIPGADLPGLFTVRTVSDTDKIKAWITEKDAKSAIVVGGGFTGLEMAENLRNMEMRVTIVETLNQVAAFLDPEMALFLQDHLETHGVELALGDSVKEFLKADQDRVSVTLASGREIVADMAILALGVKPESGLAKDAGITLGSGGGLLVEGSMRTSDPSIYAVGDEVEIADTLFPEKRIIVQLAGPAQRQGRVAAEALSGYRGKKGPRMFRGSQRTAVCGVFGMTAACTGATEKDLGRHNSTSGEPVAYDKVFVSPSSNAGYYPGSSPLFIKLLFAPRDGRILGAQALGMKGVEKRIDVISMAIQKHGTVFDLEEAELCYAPQYGSAKDPVNIAGMVAANVVRQLYEIAHWARLPKKNAFILDVRTPSEFEAGHVPGAVNIPLHVLRAELESIPEDKEILVYCQRGQRSYYATRILMQKGFKAKNISGGYVMYDAVSRMGR
jgi:NADPH-dependent 2,4-dienoyl-CoA reductase/sulfur reductase-like enzyme/rhodanese-related sulfurtransferase